MKDAVMHDVSGPWSELARWFEPADGSLLPLAVAEVRHALDQKTKPPGSLGQLELVAAQLALLQGDLSPRVDPARVIVFGGDHGVTGEGISAYPSEVTAQMMSNFAQGGAAVCVLSAANAMDVEIVDVGVNADLLSVKSIVHAKIAMGTKNFHIEPAMTMEECQAAMQVGEAAINRAAQAGARCVGLGEMGIGNTSSAAALIAMSLNLTAAEVCGRGTGVDDATLERKITVVQQAISLHRPNCIDSLSMLRCVGGFEIAAMTGAMLRASSLNMPVLVDGFISTAAALIAFQHDQSIRRCLFFSHHSSEIGHRHALAALNARPLLSLGMRLGEGSATALAYPLLHAAAAMLCNMSTFAEAGVSSH